MPYPLFDASTLVDVAIDRCAECGIDGLRKHKANLEQGVGRKRLADKDELQTGVIKQCKNHPNFTNRERYVCKCGEC